LHWQFAVKNSEGTALEVIRKHPEMVLKEGNFVTHRINWEDKASNIISICQTMSLGVHSVLVLDDNPVEREWIRRNLPDCIVPELPANISEWIDFLADYPYLQCCQMTSEDLKRSKQYAKIKEVEKFKKSFADLDDFLSSLNMELFIEEYHPSNMARVQQLISKTNQFNTTTRRYSQGLKIQ